MPLKEEWMPLKKDFLILSVEANFLLKPDATKTNAFHVKDAVNIAPKMDAFMKYVLNVKPVLLKTNAPKWMPL